MLESSFQGNVMLSALNCWTSIEFLQGNVDDALFRCTNSDQVDLLSSSLRDPNCLDPRSMPNFLFNLEYGLWPFGKWGAHCLPVVAIPLR